MIFNYKIDGINEEKILNAYTEKNGIIIIVKTNEKKRFGGYAYESFEKKYFEKSDKCAFLFNLDKQKVYKSNGNNRTIWRSKYTEDSINFGGGVDLKIFHNYLNNEGKIYQDIDFDYSNENMVLNGKESFTVSFLEIYQVI